MTSARWWLFSVLLALPLICGPHLASAHAQTPAPESVRAASAPGLLANWTAGTESILTVQRNAALHVPVGMAPAPGLAAGPFHVVLEGQLLLELRTRLTFSASGNGQVRVLVRDQVVLEGEGSDLSTLRTEAFRIRKGANPLRIEYTGPPSGAATLRLHWQGDDFVREPLPPEALVHESADGRALLAAQAETGRRLFVSHRCINCHPPDLAVDADRATFGLGASAPSFARIGERLNADWIARWILDPEAQRHGARMPQLLPAEMAESERNALARSVAADLVLDAPPAPQAQPHDPQVLAGGAKLVDDLGCATCHLLPNATAEAGDARTPLGHVAQKFVPGAIAQFLRDPTADFPSTRMPRFAFAPGEAEMVEAWLRSVATASVEPLAGDRPQACGVSVKFRCTQCHDPRPDTANPASSLSDIARSDWTHTGCASATKRAGQASFTFDVAERAALEAFRRSGLHTVFNTSAMEQARTAVDELQCQACHARDGRADIWTERVGPVVLAAANTEAEKLSQTRPELTYAGEKLHQQWMRRIFSGDAATPMRPWLRARMPAFPAHATILARGLGAEHGFGETRPVPVKADEETLKNGRFLVSREGFGCTACHWLKGEAPYATFEFGATELQRAAQRLREDHALRWLWKPQRIVRGSRMPIYASPAEPQTSQDTIWEGDAHRQFAAIWAYLNSL